ncbi:MAG: type ISP restriction/modification enzyme [Spirochaetota bacterium]
MKECDSIYEALREFSASVTEKMSQIVPGEPEEQLRGPFETFIASVANALGRPIVCTGETPLPDRLGRPDFAIHANKLLVGYVELKAPGIGATASRFKGHNHNQFKRFSAIPNILYTDGNEWALYRSGKSDAAVIRFQGDISSDGKKAVTEEDAHSVERLLRDFLSWTPSVPTDRNGKIDLKGFASLLAPLCRMLREDVVDAVKDSNSPLVQLAKDWRQLLFPDASNEQFADAYAQTVTFALLLGRSEGADPLTLENAEMSLSAQHNLLSRALQVLTDPGARREMAASLELLIRVVSVVPPAAFSGPEDPWLYFYEDFLAVYDPKLRKDEGVYYTPVEVVRAQVRLIDDLLQNRMGMPLGFADPGVVTLDPAAGTGTYLLGVVEHALGRVEKEQGPGAVPGQATALAGKLYGFELMVGPYAVTELRVSRALRDRGATLPDDGTRVYLTDTLESPHAQPPQLPLFLQPIAEQHAKALKVKSSVPVIVCLGNPPYDRHEAATGDNLARTGGWVRWGDDGKGRDAIFRDFIEPATAAGLGVHVKNLYNLYVYFWRWALWKVFEQHASPGPGVVSFISASSYLDGDAFCGMREHLRRVCDEIWVIDLGGEGRGTRKNDNVFNIQTPVAIAVAVRSGKPDATKAAKVHYVRIDGTSKEKLERLDGLKNFKSMVWQDCPDGWRSSFKPAGKGSYFNWPLMTDLMPWQQSGVKAGRTWVISVDDAVLSRCWEKLIKSKKEDRKTLFKDSPTGRKVHEKATQLPPSDSDLKPISELTSSDMQVSISRYAYRSFDRQFIISDARVLDRPGPSLWRVYGEQQLYIASLLTKYLGKGPAVTVCAFIPDLDYFSGRGAKDIIPFYRTADASAPNLIPGLLDLLSAKYAHVVMPEDFAAYVYGLLAHPNFTARYEKELETRELRVPITRDASLFEKVADAGARLLWLHTYGERFIPKGKQRGQVPKGTAKCVKAVSGELERYPESFEYKHATGTLCVGDGEFAPVSPAVFEFEVSGLKVVQSWLKYRMKKGAGKKSSPLDDIRPERWTSRFTTDLLELLWVLEETVKGYPEQAALLEAVVAGECFTADEFPDVPEYMRMPPAGKQSGGGLFDDD